MLLVFAVGCSSTVPLTDAGFPVRFDKSKFKDITDDETLDWLFELRKAQLGESADLDGDGVRETTVTRTPQGSTKWVSQPFHTAFQVEHFPDGRRVHQLFYENAGYMAQQAEFGTQPFQALFSYDSNTNNKFERRITRSLETDGGLLWVEEVDAMEKGTWVETQRWATPQWHDQSGSGGDGCQGTANMPLEIGLFEENVPGITILDSLQNSTVGCDTMRTAKLGAALRCFRERLKCLDRVNPTLRNNVASHLATDEWQLGCNNTCPGRNATSLPRNGGVPAKTNFSASFIDNATPSDLCSIVMHEAMHVAEVDYNPTDHDTNGDDQIYACSRYCADCNTRRHGATQTPNTDCATCAPTAAKKRACGLKTQHETVIYGMGICAGGFVNPACSDWKAPVSRDCNGGSPVSRPEAGCCNACPANSNNTIKPCAATLPMPTDTCSMKAPECP